MKYAKLVAAREGKRPTGVFNRVYGRLSYISHRLLAAWRFNAQSVILSRPRTSAPPN